MYESLLHGHRIPDDRPEAVTYHRGDIGDFHSRLLKQCATAGHHGSTGINRIAHHLLAWVSDARTLRLAWDDLARRGGRAPGPNQRTYDALSDGEIWSLCRALGKAIREDRYRPGQERILDIPKSSGEGTRPLILQNIEDRVVQRAVLTVVQPLLEPLFDDHSLGFRPFRERLQAMALADWFFKNERRTVWITEDIKDAFSHVPLPRLLQLVEKYVPAPDVARLIERILSNASTRGLRQGGPLSPLLLNLYLHHFLDKKWRKLRPALPLIRVADDILILCRSVKVARTAYAQLQNLLTPAGMHLKHSSERAIRTLSSKRPARWLGFELRKDRLGLRIEIGEREWNRLREALALAHTKSHPPLRAPKILNGWISQIGPCYPCYPWMERIATCQRIVDIAGEQAFDEIPSPSEITNLWQRAFARYRKLVRAVEANRQAMLPG